jgi:hypothetical protein
MSLRFDATVDRRLVHKVALENVFATDAVAAQGSWQAAVQLPRLHRLYNDFTDSRHDLLLVAEAARQGIAVIAHELLGVPLSSRFVITEMRIEAKDDDALALSVREMIIEFRTERERRRRDGALRGFSGEARCMVAGKHAASFSGTALFLPAETYAAARATEPAPAEVGDLAERAHPACVGRHEPGNVMISPLTPGIEGGHQALVVVDRDHPVFFDHPQDHMPGMLLLEAGRQLAVAHAALVSGRPGSAFRAVSCAAAFADFADLGPPVRLTALGSPSQVTIRVWQREQELAVLDIELRNGRPS